jgi:hypothetical protein
MNNLIGTVTQLVPYWSAELARYCNLGNEYSMLFNMVLNNGIKLLNEYFGEYVMFGLIVLLILLYVLKTFGIFGLESKPTKIPHTVLVAKFVNGTIQADELFKKINDYLIQTYNIKNLKMYENALFLIEEGHTFDFEDGLQLITSKIEDSIQYHISSKKINVSKLILDISVACNKYKVIYEGFNNDDKTFTYPEEIHAIINDLITRRNIKSIIYKKKSSVSKISNNNSSNGENAKYESFEDFEDYTNNNGINGNMFPTLQPMPTFNICDDLTIKIEKHGATMLYILESTKEDAIKTYVNECIYLNNNKNAIKCKYNTNICFRTVSVGEGKYNEFFTYDGKALNYWLAKQYNIVCKKTLNGVIDCCIDNKNGNATADIIENIEDENFNGDLNIKIFKNTIPLGYGKKVFMFMYHISSDKIELNEFLKLCKTKYDESKMCPDEKKLYHHVYTGFADGKCKFKTKILSKNTPTEQLNQTFNTIFNEHKEFLINDLKDLKNLAKYNRTGMKRKKSYLFHGKAGTCKTNTLVAMALHDERDIIEIPFSIIKTNDELYELMNLTSINYCNIENDKVIYAFEEIDIGLAKYDRNIKTEQDTIIIEKPKVSKHHEDNNPMDHSTFIPHSQSKLSLDTILTTFDGIGNYNGKVIVATTNYPESIPKEITRDLRLTKVEFKELRKIDAIGIIENFFEQKLNETQIAQIPDRKIIPASLVAICDRFCTMKTIDEFMQTEFVTFLEEKGYNK